MKKQENQASYDDSFKNLELAIIGGLFIDSNNRYMESIPDYLFKVPTCISTFNFLKERENVREDFVLLASEVKKDKLSKEIIETVMQGVNTISSLAKLPDLIKQLKDIRQREELYNIIGNAKGNLSEQDLKKIHEISDNKMNEVLKISSFEDICQTFAERYKTRENLYKTGVPYPTGLPSLDNNYFAGIHKKQIIVIGGRTSLGKTALMTYMGVSSSKKKAKVLMFQCEMDPAHIVDRIISNEASVENYKIMYAKLKNEDIDKIESALATDDFYKIPFYICYTSNLTVKAIKETVSIVKPDVCIVDHIQNLKYKGDNEAKELGRAMYAIHDIAVEQNVGFIIGSQINRTSVIGKTDTSFQNAGFKGSGGIEEAAERCIEIKIDAKRKDEAIWPLTLEISKNRNGPVGNLPVYFHRKTLTFTE
jgi:replicative DNA helicase